MCLSAPLSSARITISIAAAIFSILSCAPANAQGTSPMAGHNMADMQPVLSPDQAPAPIHMQGIGNSHIAIKSSPEVQAWFDQGLSLLHDFWDYESVKAFQQGIRLDPNCAMCYWGLAQAVDFRDMGKDYYSKRALAEAVRLKGKAGDAGKLYIEALQDESAAKDGKSPQAIAILRKLVKKYPNDIEARIYLFEAVRDGYDDKGEPKEGQKEGIAILESVIRDAPNDSAAHHYWIHAIESGNHPERALQSAALLASLAPTSGHMVHMPGHIFYRVGNYAEAEHWFAASTEADEKYMREQNVSVDNDWNYVHNMQYGIANLMEEGKLDAANQLSDRLAGAHGKLSASLYIWSSRDSMSRVSLRLPVALRIADWDAVLTLLDKANIPDGDKTANLRFLAAELSAYASGMKALDAGDTATAKAASDRMDAGLWRTERDQAVKDDAAKEAAKNVGEQKKDEPPTEPISPDALADPVVKALTMASLELRAGILAGDGKLDAAKKLFAAAADQEKKMGYHEPPFYVRPVAENEAAALLQAKDYVGAKAAYEAALVDRPLSGFGLFGLARVKELSGDATGAREAYASFLKTWSAADSSLPQVAHAREVLANESLAAR
jgi:predicted Zn-dependent protease